jgi:hypothetical protein
MKSVQILFKAEFIETWLWARLTAAYILKFNSCMLTVSAVQALLQARAVLVLSGLENPKRCHHVSHRLLKPIH